MYPDLELNTWPPVSECAGGKQQSYLHALPTTEVAMCECQEFKLTVAGLGHLLFPSLPYLEPVLDSFPFLSIIGSVYPLWLFSTLLLGLVLLRPLS